MVQRAGKLRYLVTIETPTESNNAIGESVLSWGTHATAWASIEALNGREFFEANQINAEITTRIEIRPLDTVTSKMRVSHNSINYDIQAVLAPKYPGGNMVLMCERNG